jgi:hypothetical protein
MAHATYINKYLLIIIMMRQLLKYLNKNIKKYNYYDVKSIVYAYEGVIKYDEKTKQFNSTIKTCKKN